MTKRIAALSTVLALFLGGCTTETVDGHLHINVLGARSPQSTSSPADETPDEISKKVEESNRRSVYGVLSGNPNEYHLNKGISDAEVEARVGLTGQEIKELTHNSFDEYNYSIAQTIRDYLNMLPSLDKFELTWLLEERVDPYFLDYATTIGYTSFDDVMNLKSFFETHFITTHDVVGFTIGLDVSSDAPPLPDKLLDAYKQLHGSNGAFFSELFSKGYPLDEIVALAQIYVTGYTFNDFEAINLVDVHTIEKLVARYPIDVAETMHEAGLTVMDLPLVEKLGVFDMKGYTKAGIKGRENIYSLSEHFNGSDANFYAMAGFSGDADTMLFLADHDVNGALAFVYSRKGITDKRAMAVLRKAGLSESALINMQLFGFLDRNKVDYSLGELLIANTVYQQYKGILEQGFPTEVGLKPFTRTSSILKSTLP
ncbi:hypothetical protein HY636_04260 [Candidatus Woesearchaeota archaeon]|nr:hypothetical protein [Candidatus Woesearchaeota archaeon]